MIVLDAVELDAIVSENPLAGSAADPSRLLAAIPARSEHLRSSIHCYKDSWDREILATGPRAAYLWCPDGIATSRLWKAVNQALGGDVTSRNWDTVLKAGPRHGPGKR